MNSPSSLMLQETEQSPAVVAKLLEKRGGDVCGNRPYLPEK